MRRGWGLLVLFTLALCLRLAAVLVLQSHHIAYAYEHGEIAENLLAGRGFSVAFLGVEGPTSQQAPFYPLLLAGCYAVFGVSPGAVLAMQSLQCLTGALVIPVVTIISWRLLPQRVAVGWMAGLAAALHPTHVYMSTHLQVAVWVTLQLSLAVLVCSGPAWPKRRLQAAAGGFLIGLMLLTDPLMALAAPILALSLWSTLRTVAADGETPGLSGRPIACVTLMTLIVAVTIAPWLWRNYRVHQECVFIKSTFWYAFWQGNNPVSWGTDKVPKSTVSKIAADHDGSLRGMQRALWEARHETLYIDDVLIKPTGYGQFAGLSEPQRARLLRDRSLEFIRENPGRYLRLCLNRLGYFLLLDVTNPKALHPVYAVTTLLWWITLVVGMWALGRECRRLWMVGAVCLVLTLFHAATITSVRFRIPLEPLTLVFCAAGVLYAGERIAGAAKVAWRGIIENTGRETARPVGLPTSLMKKSS